MSVTGCEIWDVLALNVISKMHKRLIFIHKILILQRFFMPFTLFLNFIQFPNRSFPIRYSPLLQFPSLHANLLLQGCVPPGSCTTAISIERLGTPETCDTGLSKIWLHWSLPLKFLYVPSISTELIIALSKWVWYNARVPIHGQMLAWKDGVDSAVVELRNVIDAQRLF